MRKAVLTMAMTLFAVCGAMAQESEQFYKVGNRLGVGVGVGTEGISFDASTCLSKYVHVRAGLTFMPNITFDADVDVDVDGGPNNYSQELDVTAEGALGRTSFDLKFDVYPFPESSSFFVSAGFSAGGSKLIKISAQSDQVAELIQQGYEAGINIGDYNIPFDREGRANGYAKVSGFRPYLGLGFGRAIPKKRVACRFEMGVQFHGKPKIYADGVGDLEAAIQSADDDISDFIDKLTVYPVLKFSIRGRIL